MHLSRTRYRPSALLRDLINTRDRTCRFPGCTRPAPTCDTDHLTPWPDGPTNPDNLHPLCRTHHQMKTDRTWQPSRDPDTGTTTWTSPLGATHTTPAATYPNDAPGSHLPYPHDPQEPRKNRKTRNHRFPTPDDHHRTLTTYTVEHHLATTLELTMAGHAPRRLRPPRPPSATTQA